MACPPRAGDRVGAEAAWTEGLDINLGHSAPEHLTENGMPALGLITGAGAPPHDSNRPCTTAAAMDGCARERLARAAPSLLRGRYTDGLDGAPS